MPELRKYIPDIQLVILGQGVYYNKLEKLVQSLNLKECVHLMGAKSNPYKYMYNADIFVLTSLYEGFPNVLVEAMSVGLPIVSVDCKSGPRELLNDDVNITIKNNYFLADYGILTPDFLEDNCSEFIKEKFLKEAIIKLLKNKKLYCRYRELSINRSKEFTSAKMMNYYKKYID